MIKIKCSDYNYENIIFTAYEQKTEVGLIQVKPQSSNYFQIELFYVTEQYRRQGIGKKLLKKLINKLKSLNCTTLTVVPASVSYDGDSVIDRQTLYTIYQNLGFQFQKPNNNSDSLFHTMFLTI